MATTAAATTFVRVYSSPEGEQTRNQFESRQGRYRYLWSWYQSSVFDDAATWAVYKSRYGLYRHIRPIYNPARRLVDFYAGSIYPGILTIDAARLPDGTPIAIPLAEDVAPALTSALGQLWQWSNWQANKSLMPRYGAAVGDVLAHVVDDPARGKCWMEVVWPGLVRDLDLDDRGNVVGYALEYEAADEDGNTYTWTRQTDKAQITTLVDGKVVESHPNPYGFVPAVWAQHTYLGGDHGDPAMRNLPKWDELNSVASMAHDQVKKTLNAPILLAGVGASRVGADQSKAGSSHDLSAVDSSQESINILRGGPDATMHTLSLPQGEALAYMQSMLEEIERDHPELGMYHQLRSMSQVTGPAADRLFGDVATLLNDARANYDRASVALFQMAVAIGGWRAQRGDWGRQLTRQQEKFLPYDLESYVMGDLDMEILPRPLVPQTPLERLQEERARQALARDAGTPGPDAQAGSVPSGVMARLNAISANLEA